MNWYYLENSEQRGPVTEPELTELAQRGTIGPDTYVWADGMTDWKRYREVSASQAGAVPPTSPPAPEVKIEITTTPAAVSKPLVTCLRCGAEVPASQTVTIGTMTLCPKCQVGYERQLRGEGPPMVYASPILRLVAFVLDGIVCNAVAGAFLFGMYWLATNYFPERQTQLGIMLIGAVCALLWVLNYFVGRIGREGATPVMKLLRLQIVTPSGAMVGTWRALARILVIALVNTFTAGLGHLTVFFDQRKRSLTDMICGTVVIKR